MQSRLEAILSPGLVVIPFDANGAWQLFLPLARRRGAFLLDSASQLPGSVSYLGADPVAEFVARGERWSYSAAGGERREGRDPFRALAKLLADRRRGAAPGLPRFQCGAVAMVSYDAGRLLERLPTIARDDLPLPWIHVFFYDELIAIDHDAGQGQALAVVRDGDEKDARARAAALVRRATAGMQEVVPVRAGAVTANLSRADFEAAVKRAKAYIREGDVFQVNLSQRFEAPCPDALGAHASLRSLNPSPMMAYLDAGRYRIASCSPERLLRVDGRRAVTRPIAGTRQRGVTPDDDARLAAELRANEKELAEHVMLVDLERNDLGRACEFGSVRVSEFLTLERYSHVTHLVSEVEGTLRDGVHSLDAVRAMFPGGTITGCPKVRCMEVIEGIEPVRRGPYSGSLGFLSDTGAADFNILIRTIVESGGVGHAQAGAGIVADSVPEREHEECLHKARAMLLALGVV